MSSLALSLVLLIAIAIAAALLYNLRQSGWRGWKKPGRAEMPGSGRRDNGTQRGEPRLGGESVRVSAPVSATSAMEDAPAKHDPEQAPPVPGTDAGQPGGSQSTTAPASVRTHETGAGADRKHPVSDRPVPSDSGTPGSVMAATIRTDASVSGYSGPVPSLDGAPDDPSVTDAAAADPSDDSVRERAGAGVVAAATAESFARHTGGSTIESGRPSGDSSRDPDGGAEGDGGSDMGVDPGGGTAGQNAAAGPGRRQPATVATVAGAAAEPVLSDVADCVIELVPEAPLSGERLQLIAMRMRRAGSKPVAIDAKPIDGAEFEAPAAGRNYAVMRAGVLLVNRHGALNAMEFSDFSGAVQALAESLPAQTDIPAMGPVLARARELDAICAQLDVQIGINVEAAAPIENGQLAAIAHDLELVEQISQRYVRLDPHGAVLFSLAFADVPERVTFLLDVPRVPAGMMPFEKMVQAATTCARRLGASLVDDGGRTLSQASLAQIARQLGQRYESLEAIGLPAGSSLACKVFN